MLKKILKLENVVKLSKNELLNTMGSQKVPTGNCRCFCYIKGTKVSNSCFTYCPNGSIPGLFPESTGNCNFPLSLQ